ncbi:MAG: hypothetical protein AAF297_07705, partial [Planctomycetota bacterium]
MFVPAAFGGMVLGPSPYLELADSPFLDRAGFVFEDFEDGSFDLPWASTSAGNPLAPAGNVDSVDGDDGAVDGFGREGWSFFSPSGGAGITISFDIGIDAPVITSAGLVWTDGAGLISFSAFDRDGNLIGTVDGTHADGGFG